MLYHGRSMGPSLYASPRANDMVLFAVVHPVGCQVPLLLQLLQSELSTWWCVSSHDLIRTWSPGVQPFSEELEVLQRIISLVEMLLDRHGVFR